MSRCYKERFGVCLAEKKIFTKIFGSLKKGNYL